MSENHNDWIDKLQAHNVVSDSFGREIPITYESKNEELLCINFEGEDFLIERGLLRKLFERGIIGRGVKV